MKAGRFHDFWRGNGWFVSVDVRGGWLLLAFRPKCWRLRIVRPPAKPGVTRFYVGPFEFERAAMSQSKTQAQPPVMCSEPGCTEVATHASAEMCGAHYAEFDAWRKAKTQGTAGQDGAA